MICETCPYIIEPYSNITECYCEKLGCKIQNVGPCEEEKIMPRPYIPQPPKWNRYERKMRYKAKLKRLSDMNLRYPAPAYPVGDYDIHTQKWENIKYYKRYYKANHAPGYNGFLKRRASKKFRRYTGELPNGCGYKKTFDYWWELI